VIGEKEKERKKTWLKAHPDRRKLYAQQWYKKQPPGSRAKVLRDWLAKWKKAGLPPPYRLRKYGLTASQYLQMAKEQKNRCAVCRAKVPLDIDHDHRTNKARGLLCRKCNTAIGSFQDSPMLLRKAADYLEKYRPKRGVK
jgi:hypothetical protein